VRRAAALLLALAALVAAGCNSGDDDQGSSASGPREVTTTKVKVVQGIGGQGSGFDPAEIYKRLSPGVVTVLSVFKGASSLLDSDGEGGQGSGFVLDGKGYIATNAHVVTNGDSAERAEQVFVEFSDGNRVSANVVGVDLNADVALLKVDPAGLSLTPLTLGESHNIEVGEPVAAIGSPFGERQSLSIGVISALDRNIDSLTQFKIGDAIQTDAAINPGNSGGPLLDAHGRVLGINAQIKSQSGGGEGVGFAIPVDAVRRSLEALREHGRVDYGYLGVSALALWPQLAERLGLDVRNGALVQDIEGDSPAEKAGLRAGDHEIKFQAQDVSVGGDVIVAVDGKPLTRAEDLADRISSLSTGNEVELDVVRDGTHKTVQVELGQRPRGSG
jgi:S1-C subfamily serine protease